MVWEKAWFDSECDLFRKECIIKNYLKHVCDPQYQLFHEHVKQYKKSCVKNK